MKWGLEIKYSPDADAIVISVRAGSLRMAMKWRRAS